MGAAEDASLHKKLERPHAEHRARRRGELGLYKDNLFVLMDYNYMPASINRAKAGVATKTPERHRVRGTKSWACVICGPTV
jgi:hypothetical protein